VSVPPAQVPGGIWTHIDAFFWQTCSGRVAWRFGVPVQLGVHAASRLNDRIFSGAIVERINHDSPRSISEPPGSLEFISLYAIEFFKRGRVANITIEGHIHFKLLFENSLIADNDTHTNLSLVEQSPWLPLSAVLLHVREAVYGGLAQGS